MPVPKSQRFDSTREALLSHVSSPVSSPQVSPECCHRYRPHADSHIVPRTGFVPVSHNVPKEKRLTIPTSSYNILSRFSFRSGFPSSGFNARLPYTSKRFPPAGVLYNVSGRGEKISQCRRQLRFRRSKGRKFRPSCREGGGWMRRRMGFGRPYRYRFRGSGEALEISSARLSQLAGGWESRYSSREARPILLVFRMLLRPCG